MKNLANTRAGGFVVMTIGGVAIVAIFFFGTLFTLDYFGPDSVRATHAKSIKAALEAYRQTRGNYPYPFPDNPLTDLKKELVDGGFLKVIPKDPVFGEGSANQYRYVSFGKNYGLLFHLSNGKTPPADRCLTGVGTAGTGFWGTPLQPPDCPF